MGSVVAALAAVPSPELTLKRVEVDASLWRRSRACVGRMRSVLDGKVAVLTRCTAFGVDTVRPLVFLFSLSFAGEQMAYVRKVAAVPRGMGVRPFTMSVSKLILWGQGAASRRAGHDGSVEGSGPVAG